MAYELLEDMYSDCLTTNLQIRKYIREKEGEELFHIQTKGVYLFNKEMYDYCLLLFTCKNKLRLYEKIINDIDSMPRETKNYIFD